ncbi:MAG TPA: hypothetical protein VGJ62_06370 [Gemmatimonadaceae bacterium]
MHAAPDAANFPVLLPLLTARNLGVRLARVASALKIVRVTTTQRQVEARAYITRGE